MSIRRILAALCACLSLMAPSAFAAVIDFETVAQEACTAAPISSKGFTFSGSEPRCVFGPPDEPIENASNGTYFLIDGRAPVLFNNDAGQSFSISSIDLGISFFMDVSPNFVTLTGFFADGGQISETLTLTFDFQTYALAGFKNLSALTISNLRIPANADGDPGYIAIDNLVLDDNDGPPNGAVPVPASLPLFALGMGVMAFMRRRFS